jgi:hypothetical protein
MFVPPLNAKPLPQAEEQESVFREAERIIYGDREQTYGDPSKNLNCIADFWCSYLRSRFGQCPDIGAEDVAAMMALLKIAREAHLHKRDNIFDAIGYLGLIERIT